METTSKLFMIAAIVMVSIASNAKADHPNQGDQTLESLSSTAISNSLELKALDQQIESLQLQQRVSFGAFAPRFSIEAGPQYSNVAGQKNSGTSIYGKAEWNLYRGGQDQIDAQIASERAEGLRRQRTALEKRIQAEVAEAFYEMQFAAESVALKKEALRLNTEQQKSALSKNKAGFTAKSDVLEFDLRETIIMSDIVMADQVLSQSARKMSTLIGRSETDSNLRIKGHLERVSPPEINRAILVEGLSSNNVALQKAQIEKSIVSLEMQREKSAYYPKLDFETKYGKLGNAERVNPDNNDLTMLLKVSIPLFSGLDTTHRVKSLAASSRAMEFDVALGKNHLLEELDSLISTLEATQKRLDVEEKNLDRSRAYYDATLQEYRKGLKNSPDMVTASERVLEAKIRNLEFRRDLSVALARISRLTGISLK